jgi:hypothetical protein
MLKNIILQHFDGELRELDKLSIENIKQYAHKIRADYELVVGKPFRNHLTPACQKVYCVDKHWDDYGTVLMLDIDVFVRKDLSENVFKISGHGVHGPTQVKLKQKLIDSMRIDQFTPYWAGSIYKFNKKEREQLRDAMPSNDIWMNFYNKPYHFEDEGILADLACRSLFRTSYLDFSWSQCSFLPNPEKAKMLHIRTKKPGHIDGTWENGGKQDKIKNYHNLVSLGII